MIIFFKNKLSKIIAVEFDGLANNEDIPKLTWLLAGDKLSDSELTGSFVGPKKEMVSPWSTNAVEITQNMGIDNVIRIEEYKIEKDSSPSFDAMLEMLFSELNQELFTINVEPEPVIYIDDIKSYNQQEGLAMNEQ